VTLSNRLLDIIVQIPNYVIQHGSLKRIVAIVCLVIFLFNVVGYYGVYLSLRLSANTELRQKLDNQAYNEDETITVKIPFTLPYQSDWEDYKRVDGDFEKNGEFYNLVKQKVERDTLVIVYIKDHKEKNLFESLTEFVHANTDTPISKKAGKLIESFAKDFLSTRNELQTASIGWSIKETLSQPQYKVIYSIEQVLSPPPKSTL
jgi:hypothetical protein